MRSGNFWDGSSRWIATRILKAYLQRSSRQKLLFCLCSKWCISLGRDQIDQPRSFCILLVATKCTELAWWLLLLRWRSPWASYKFQVGLSLVMGCQAHKGCGIWIKKQTQLVLVERVGSYLSTPRVRSHPWGPPCQPSNQLSISQGTLAYSLRKFSCRTKCKVLLSIRSPLTLVSSELHVSKGDLCICLSSLCPQTAWSHALAVMPKAGALRGTSRCHLALGKTVGRGWTPSWFVSTLRCRLILLPVWTLQMGFLSADAMKKSFAGTPTAPFLLLWTFASSIGPWGRCRASNSFRHSTHMVL